MIRRTEGLHFKMTLSAFAFIVAFEILYGEILTFKDSHSTPDIVECTDGSTECVINCLNTVVCRYKHIHFHRTSTNSICKINLSGSMSAQNASIFTHQSPIVSINVTGHSGC